VAASFEGHKKVVEMLLEKGADVNAQGGDYGNALHAASVEGHEKVVEMLLEKGADVYMRLISACVDHDTARGVAPTGPPCACLRDPAASA
jgi:ankyrin repeat protein